jgi:DNA-binding NtrC family response regulator
VVQALSVLLKSHGLDNVLGCEDSREVMSILQDNEVETVLLDLNMPHVTGRLLLAQIGAEYPHIPVIVVTAANDVQTAVDCMGTGAFDYMVKAVEPSRLVSGIRRAVESREQKRSFTELRTRFMTGDLQNWDAFSSIITRSAKMKSIFLYVEAVAGTVDPVLITGETGVGKELIARAIHRASGRNGDFIAVNAAGRAEDKLADDLFGHAKWAFTDAKESRNGLIQKATGGTLFLDEIGDLSENAQIKLLRFLDGGEYYSLGSDVTKRSDARIVLATNRDLGILMNERTFRRDLYFRISTHEILVPPLRERKEDLPLLLEHFTRLEAVQQKKKGLSVPAELAAQISSYPFPGNVRELLKLVKRAVTTAKPSDAVLPVQPIIEATRQDSPASDASRLGPNLQFGDILPTLQQVRALLTEEALTRSGRNISEAARLLGISHQALSKWLSRRKGG